MDVCSVQTFTCKCNGNGKGREEVVQRGNENHETIMKQENRLKMDEVWGGGVGGGWRSGGGPDKGRRRVVVGGLLDLSRTSPPYTPTWERRDLRSLGGREGWKEAGEQK